MDEQRYWKEVAAIENVFRKKLFHLPLSYPKPENLGEEKQRFLASWRKGIRYEPQFRFEKQVIHPVRLSRFVRDHEISVNDDLYGFKRLYREKLEERAKRVWLYYRWGDLGSARLSERLYGVPSSRLVEAARDICSQELVREKEEEQELQPQEIGTMLADSITSLTGETFQIKYSSQLVNKMNINAKARVITINSGTMFSSGELCRLLVHEIGTHFMRYANGVRRGIYLLEIGTPDYLATEEGLAVVMEAEMGVQTRSQLREYAGRVLAVHYARYYGFHKVFSLLVRDYGFDEEEAFTLTSRAKRCLYDTGKEGAYTKDHVYLKGYYQIQRFRKRGDLWDLFIGKIALKDLERLHKYIAAHQDDQYLPKKELLATLWPVCFKKP